MSDASAIARREAIAEYRLDGDGQTIALQGIVELAATVCKVSTAVVNIIDDRYQHQIAAVGFTPAICSREDSMCAAVLSQETRVVVHDARDDARFAENPFVTGAIANVRFYASSPLTTPAGVTIGTLCVFDEEVGDLSPEDARGLDLLARQVVDLLELRRMTHELGRSNEQLENFAGQVSHDLRNPLTALAGFLELAADSPDMANAPRAAYALSRAESAATRMSTMVTSLLAFARLGGSTPTLAEIDVAVAMRSVTEDLDATIHASRATVRTDAEGTVSADPTLLHVLLQNLVANAVKFTAATGRRPSVRVTARTLPSGARITVDDDGPGIPVDDRERVFGLMERGTVGDVPGLGIGLSACRRVVEAHGGRIGIEESPDGGTRVWVLLPEAPRE